ncbi:MAG TPA: DUF1501 domain-containing protein [Planctomycetaceae bacterium]|nr:DUF1501 domain-containing protein [Planctomycetaceae bacterium]
MSQTANRPGWPCGAFARRDFLKIGAAGLGAASLSLGVPAPVLARGGSRHKAIIHIFLNGGPPHQDMWDLKPDAPAEVRGEFDSIETKVPGIRIGEVFPMTAAVLDKCAVIRSITGSVGPHDAWQCMTGWPGIFSPGAAIATRGRPSIGSVLSRLHGPVDITVPPYIRQGPNKVPITDGRSNAFRAGFLGPAHDPLEPDLEGMQNLTVRGIALNRLSDRRALRDRLDNLRRDLDARGTMQAMDLFNQSAADMLNSNKLLDAMDVAREPDHVRQRYGSSRTYMATNIKLDISNDYFLMARRLVEAGARCVTLDWGSWDFHDNNFRQLRDIGGQFDRGFSALVEDLHERGLSDDVLVIAWGEFGRTPRINAAAGRDHWPPVNCAILAGGGMRMGQVIGATDRLGERVLERPVHFQEVTATLYHQMGIDTAATTIRDASGRPQYLVEHPPIRELI